MSELFNGKPKILHTLAKQTPLTHAIIKSQKYGSDPALTVAVVLFVLVGFVVGIILCNKYGLKNLSASDVKNIQSLKCALRNRFNLGLGTGIIAVTVGGKIGMLIIGLVILFVLGYEIPLVEPHGRSLAIEPEIVRRYEKRIVQKRYYMGLATGGLLGLVANKLLVDALSK